MIRLIYTLGFNTLRNKKYNFLFNSDTKRKKQNDNYKSLVNETNKLMVGFKKKIPGYAIYKKQSMSNKIILPSIKRNQNKYVKKGFKTEKEKIILEKSEESGSVGGNSNEEKSDKENEGSKDE